MMNQLVFSVGAEVEGVCASWFSDGRGYGFIRIPGAERDLFVHARNLLDSTSLNVGDRVRCEVRLDRDGRFFADSVETIGVRVS